MTSTLEVVRPETLPEAPGAAPAKFKVWFKGVRQQLASALGRKGSFVGRTDLTVDDRKLTVSGPYLARKTALRTAVHWTVFLATVVVVTLAFQFLVMDLLFAFAVGLAASGVVIELLEWARRRSRTADIALSDVAVERVKGRRLRIAGPFELERPDLRSTVVAVAHTKEEAAALAQALEPSLLSMLHA